MSETCGNCKWFNRLAAPNSNLGNCHAAPPTAVVIRYVSGEVKNSLGAPVPVMNGMVDGYFAPTSEAVMACGSWKKTTADSAKIIKFPVPDIPKLGETSEKEPA